MADDGIGKGRDMTNDIDYLLNFFAVLKNYSFLLRG
jgi:hypothetical protein